MRGDKRAWRTKEWEREGKVRWLRGDRGMVSNKTWVEPVPVPTTFPPGRGHYRLYLLLSCLSLFAHTILFHLLRRVHLLSHFLFLDPSHSRPFPPSPISRPFETFMTETDVTRKRKKSDASEERLEGDGTRRSQGIRGIRMVGMIAVRDERTTTTVAVVRAWNCNYTARTRAHHRISHGRF